MSIEMILLIVVVVFLLGGGGWYWQRGRHDGQAIEDWLGCGSRADEQ